MLKCLLAILLTLTAPTADCAVLPGSSFSQDATTDLILQLLSVHCPDQVSQLTAEHKVTGMSYKDAMNELIKCHQIKGGVEVIPNLHKMRLTTPSPVTETPVECLNAANLTESWRLEHSGDDVRPAGPNSLNGYACDLRKSLKWFRFTGEAGDQMLDACPSGPEYSCGTRLPIWTDEEMPKSVGVTAKIKIYSSNKISCKFETREVVVLRCSWDTDHDFVYRQNTDYYNTCRGAFCGMKAK